MDERGQALVDARDGEIDDGPLPEGATEELGETPPADAAGEGEDDPEGHAAGTASGSAVAEEEGDEEGDDPSADRGPGPGDELSDDELVRRVAALLFASAEPLSEGKLVTLLERPRRPRVRAALETLAHRLEAADLPLQVRGLKGGHTLMTAPELGPVLARLTKGGSVERISAAALETLAIIAYRQPVTKAEVEAIRGVQAGPVLRSLVDRGLVRVTGRADVPGHPLQYGTSKDFLDRFGLKGLEELPRDAELARD